MFELFKGSVDVEHRLRREQTITTGLVAHHFGCEIAARSRHVVRRLRAGVEPSSGRRSKRQYACRDAVLVHRLDILIAGPGELNAKVGDFALILPVGPGFLIGRWVEMMMGIDQLRSSAATAGPRIARLVTAQTAEAAARNVRRDG